MSRGECPNPQDTCPYYMSGCYSDTHHLAWPSDNYLTTTEKAYRELPEMKVQICRNEHDLIHYEAPPEKPDREEMVQRITVSGIYLSINKRKALGMG